MKTEIPNNTRTAISDPESLLRSGVLVVVMNKAGIVREECGNCNEICQALECEEAITFSAPRNSLRRARMIQRVRMTMITTKTIAMPALV